MFARGEHAASDETATYEALYDRYHARLVRYCRRRLWNKADAEDAAHETLLRAFRALPVELRGNPWPWLTTIAGRICTDVRRRASRHPLPAVAEAEGDTVHEEVVERLRADILDDALRRLPDHYRTPLLLREYGGWAYDDIARLQGRSVGSVRSLLARSRRRLEAQVETVARTRNQWPLPATVPPVRRFRAWRDELARSPHAVMGAIDASSMVTRWATGAGATLAGMMTFATAAVASVYPAVATLPAQESVVASSPPALVWQVRGSDVRHLAPPEATARADAVAAVTTRETLTRFDATTPSPDWYSPGIAASGGAGIDETPGLLWISHSETATLPVVGDYSVSSGTVTVPCKGQVRTLACDAIRTTTGVAPD